ncbi:MAG: restriction endonuclease subunit S [Pseudonocardiaceae bacterium]
MADDVSALGERLWTMRSVDDLCAVVTSGGTPSRSNPDFFNPGTVPWIKTGDLMDWYITKYDEYISDSGVVNSSAKLLPADTILLAMYGATVGRLGILSEPATCNQAACAMVVDPDAADPRWLFYVLLNDRRRIASEANGAAQQNLSARAIKAFRYLTPALDEQRAISEVLGALDDKIAANDQLAAMLAMLAAAIFDQAISTSSLEQSIAEIAEFVGRGIAPDYSDSGDTITVLNQKCIRDQVVLLSPARRTLRVCARTEKILLPNDVLINSTGQGTLGRVARWTYDCEATVDSHISIVRFDDRFVDPICGGYGILRLQSLIEQMGQGSTGQTELSRVELAKVRLRLPERDVQLELGHRLGALAELQDAQRSQNNILVEMRNTLLPQLMSGKIRVRDVEKRVEEVL